MVMRSLAKDGPLEVAAGSLTWVAKNVFLVAPLLPAAEQQQTAEAPSPSLVGFELSSVDIPHFSSPGLAAVVHGIIALVNASGNVQLRRDHFTRFPLEGYGDIIFEDPNGSGGVMCSFQERLLSVGIARIVRPGLRNSALIAAEVLGEKGDSWASKMIVHREESLYRCGSGVVVDVIRGDTVRLYISDLETLLPQHIAQQISAPPYCGVVLARLKGVECADPSSEVGFQALRYAQTNFYQRRVQFVLYSFSFCDHDMANNTQEVEYHQLQHIEVSATLLPPGSPVSRSDSTTSCVDVEETILRLGLGRLVRVADASMPRGVNFRRLLATTDEVVASKSINSLLELWSAVLADGDVLQERVPPCHGYLPLKFITSMQSLVAKAAEMELTGFISGVRFLEGGGGGEGSRLVAAVEIDMGVEGNEILKWRRERQQESLGEVNVFPDPRDDQRQFGSIVDVEVRYDPLLSGIDPTQTQIEYCCTMYENELVPDTHRPIDGDYSPCGQQIRLQLPANPRQDKGSRIAFVLDIRVKFAHLSQVLRRRDVFILCPSGRNHIATESANMDEDVVEVGRQDDDDEMQQPSLSSPTTKAAPTILSEDGGIHADKIYHALLDFYFPVELPRDICEELFADIFMFRPVKLSPSHVVELCSRRGFVGKLCFDDAEVEQAFDDMVDQGALSSTQWSATNGTPTISRSLANLLVRAEAAPRRLLRDGPLGRVPSLISFALFPRMFFASHPKHHRSLVPEADHKKVRGLAHLDAAFMRLHFPRLPNLFRMNWERMPYRCRDIQQQFFLPKEDPMCALSLLDAKGSVDEFVAYHHTLAKFLALIASILPRRNRSAQFHEYQANVELGVSSLSSSGLLCILEDSRLFLGSKAPVQAIVEDDIVAPVNLSAGFLATLISTVGSEVVAELAAGASSEVAPVVAARGRSLPNSYLDRVLGHHGQGDMKLSTAQVLYSPLPGLAVIGDPLMEKNDETTSLMMNANTSSNTTRKQILLRFTPLRLSKSSLKTYRVSSYGQLSREVVYNMALTNAARGRDLVDYMDVLLHRSLPSPNAHAVETDPTAACADGILRTYGSAHEPLHVLYTSRATLRFTSDLSWKISSRADDMLEHVEADGDQRAKAIQDEQVFLKELWTALAEALKYAAADAPPGHAFFLFGQSFIEDGLVELSVYPREEEAPPQQNSGDATDESGGRQARRFAMRGNVFGRLACRKVIIQRQQGTSDGPRFVVSVRELRRDVVASQRLTESSLPAAASTPTAATMAESITTAVL